MTRVRQVDERDLDFLRLMLFEAAFWRAEVERPPIAEALAEPELARYLEEFGRSGDFGVMALDLQSSEPQGAAWWRLFPRNAPGFGFVDDRTPEISIAVVPELRGGGVGTELLRSLIAEAGRQNIKQLSLSVERDNPALRLYERFGFHHPRADKNLSTLVVDIPT